MNGTSVPAGKVVRTGYVPINDVVIWAMSPNHLLPEAVEKAYRNLLALDGEQPWPCPIGHWTENAGDGRRFVVTDGRNRYVAALMLGYQHLLVAWEEQP